MNDIEFSALLCSRLCHDLISPVGAIANGIEILNDEDDEMMRQEVMKLLEHSAVVTSNRLKFFRLSFGAAGGFGERVPLSEAKNAAESLYASSNIDLSWKSDYGEMNKDALKLMLNMVLLAGESLVRGGKMLVEIRDQSPKVSVRVTVQGDRVILQDSVLKGLLGELAEDQIEAKSAPAFLVATVARKLDAAIEYSAHNDQSFSLQLIYQETEKQEENSALSAED